ncbi:bifunctional helix-turn-helix transcriptional regulator/GNAT family N-acetyltransferase [Rhodovibrionaceae bacterium A322]
MPQSASHSPEVSAEQIATVRQYNRFYTRQIGLLNEGIHKSSYSLAQARIIYELAHCAKATASDLARDLAMDAGYLSRLVKKLLNLGLLEREQSANDGRQFQLSLSPEGRAVFAELNQSSKNEIRETLTDIPVGERDQLVRAMQSIQDILGQGPEPKVPYILRDPQPGDFGWIIHRQALLYHQEYGWDETFEGLVSEIMGSYIQNHDPKWERCWVAERHGEVIGSIFCVKESETVAKLRLLYVDSRARGLGVGSRLVDEVIRFARAKGYKKLTFWTNDILVSARRIYQAAGFELVEESPHHSFGKDLVGQIWSMDL